MSSLSGKQKKEFLKRGAFFLLGALLIFAAARLETTGLARLLLLSSLQLLPFCLCMMQRRMDYLSIILGGEFVGYSLSPLCQFLLSPATARLTPTHLHAVDLLIVCTLVWIGLFFLVRLLSYRDPFRAERFHALIVNRKTAALAGLLLSVSFWVGLHVPRGGQQFFLSCQFLITVFIFCISAPSGVVLLRVFQVIAFFGSFIAFLTDTNLGFAINLLVIWITQMVIERRARLAVKVALLLFYMVALQAVKYDFRSVVARNPQLDIVQRAQVLGFLLDKRFVNKSLTQLTNFRWASGKVSRDIASLDSLDLRGALMGALGRAHDESLEKVLELTPEPVPFWRGSSYFNFVFLLIPKWIWPAKPAWNLWNEFGHKYGYLGSDDTSTIVLFSYFAEGYMNFRYVGLALVTIFLALLIALVEKLSERDVEGYYSFTFIALLMPLLAYQTDLGSLLVRLIYVLAVVVPFLFFHRKQTF